MEYNKDKKIKKNCTQNIIDVQDNNNTNKIIKTKIISMKIIHKLLIILIK